MRPAAKAFREMNCRRWTCTVLILCTMLILLAAQTPAHADAFKVIYNFCSEINCTDGLSPSAPLGPVAGFTIYGTTSGGGTSSPGTIPPGTIFKIDLSGKLTTLFNFDYTNGAAPDGLIGTFNGTLFGTTALGGTNDQGTVFEFSNDSVTTLHSFNRHENHDGDTPTGLLQATNGLFYGTTGQGGTNPGPFGFGAGTIYEITSDGTITILYNFCSETNCADGVGPAPLIQARNGNLYGTTGLGGTYGHGTIFEISPNGGTLTTLHSFDNSDGSNPDAAVIQASDGNLYGTTSSGGTYGFGTVFEISPDGGTLRTLHEFEGTGTDGAGPYAALLQAWDGNLYGTTVNGGTGGGVGTIFKITLKGNLTTLHSFNGTDGANPDTALIQGPFGILYGTTPNGGANGQGGTVFEQYVTPFTAP